MRLASGAEALVVRIVTPEGVPGYGFTFCEDIAAARAMACWDAAARRAAMPLARMLSERHPEALDALELQMPAAGHPWSDAWRAELAAARANPRRRASREAPGAGIDWPLEPGFTQLRWIEPETMK